MTRTLAVLLLLVCLAGLMPAQVTTAEVLGTIKDATGAVVTGAKVTARNVDTNQARELTTSVDGRFRFTQLPTGNYEVIVEKSGFGKYVRGPITLRIGADAEFEISLAVAGVNEVVTVTGDAPQINTTNAEVGVNFDVKRIMDLPLAPNRNVLNLALGVAGVSQLSSGNSGFTSGGVSFSVNGMRTRSNNFMIDGGDSNNASVGGSVQEINNPDVVAEFRLVTNQFLPEYGRAAGSVVNIITKSGTNAFHGSAFWSHNDNKLNARSNLDKRTFTRAPWRVENLFGGTVGGPIAKDKTFFFVSGLRWYDRQFQSGTAITGAPTAEGQELLRRIVGSQPQVAALLAHLPAAQTPTGATRPFTWAGQTYNVPLGTLSGAGAVQSDIWQWTYRVDHRLNDKFRLMGRYMLDDRISVSGQTVPPGLTSQSPAGRNAMSVNLDYTVGPTMFNSTRLNFQRISSQTIAADAKAITIPNIEIAELGLTGFNAAASRTAIGLAVNLPQSQALTNYQLANDFGWLKGSHSMKFGFDFRRQDQNQDFNPTLRGRLNYVSLNDFVNDIGQVASINVLLPGVPRWQGYKYYDYAFYLQDEWRVLPRLTLTYGMRYETPGNPAEWLSKVNQKVVAANNNNPGYVFAPVPPRDKNNWAPRFGFNFKLTGKTVLRGGYSRTYDLVFNNIYLNIFSAWPFTQVVALPARTTNAFRTINGIAFQGLAPPAITNPLLVTRTMVANDFRAPYAEQFSFQVQRTLAADWALTMGWVGTKGTALFQTVDGNPMIPGTGGVWRVNGLEGIRRLRANTGSSIYHSFQTSLEKRLSKNFALASHYTWSAFIDDQSEIFNASVAGEVAVAQDSFNRRADRGRATYDRPHRLSMNGVYELPWLRDQQGVAGRLLGGWQITGFLTFQAGAPFSPLDGGDPGFRLSGIDSLVGNSIRPNLNTTQALSSMTVNEILAAGGASLFSRVTAASPLGNAGRNILRADGINNLDFTIQKNFKVSESNTLMFRSEFYNSGNTRDYGIPEARVNNPGFAQQGNTNGGNRRIVFLLRYMF
jgi:outer membrane receptor protein involved in Fe transport